MKEAMWKADSYSGSRFRDPLSRDQIPLALEGGVDIDDLGLLMINRIDEVGPTSP